MSLSQDLFQLQEYDTALDRARARLAEIDHILADRSELDAAQKLKTERAAYRDEKRKDLAEAEQQVQSQNQKIETNQLRLYGGAITNPKELEALQLESSSLGKYLEVLEERQLAAMLAAEAAQDEYETASSAVEALSEVKTRLDHTLLNEKADLEKQVESGEKARRNFLEKTAIPDLDRYQQLRKSLNGIAVTLMVADSCASCGSNIPSAIAQEVRAQKKLTPCPACKRILHPG